MQFNTAFNCGDKGWTFDGSHVVQRTIGQIRIQYTKSEGLPDGSIFSGDIVTNDGENYGPQAEEYEEVYMCVETGIGSGSLLTLGKHIFVTKEECEIACAEAIREKAERDESARRYKEEQLEKEERRLRERLEYLESRKRPVAA